jgi:plastocyanin
MRAMGMRVPTLVGALLVAFAVPAAAHAATRTVDMGLPLNAQNTFNRGAGSDVNDFFPHATTIHVGDSVKFVPTSFHTVDLPRKGGPAVSLVLPTAQTVSGEFGVDAAGAPFWFAGGPVLGFNPLLVSGGKFGKKVAYNGSKRVESGAPLSARAKPMTVKFTKTGSYTFFCDIHAGMKGTVKVVSKRSSIPSAKADAQALKTQLARDLKAAKKLAHTAPTPGTISVGASAPGGVEYYGFFPTATTVPVGTTLTFRMSKSSFEDHTASTGPGDPEHQPATYLGGLAASFQGVNLDPRAVYPSEKPGTLAASLTPTFHGNGFWSSGVMDNSSTTPALPSSSAVTLAAPGTYQFYCLIHPFMHTTITVQ